MSDKHKSSNYTPIQCQLYDYIEIACMRHYHLDIELTSGDIISGLALTTKIKNKQEYLVISLETTPDKIAPEVKDTTQNKEQEIRLDLIKSLTALDENAEFKTVEIN